MHTSSCPVIAMLSVLYVDDEPNLLEIGKIFLELTDDFSVDTAVSASEALVKLHQKPYDAIVSDYLMPVMDGIKFLQTLRGAGNSIPFIIFTGRGREDVIIEALNSGVDFYLQKGGDPTSQFAELKNIIIKAVRQKSADDALKTSEAKYRRILENIQDVYYRSDVDGNLILASPSMATVLGYDSLSEIYGKNIAGTLYYNPERRTQFLADINRSGSVTNYEVTLKKRDGTPVSVLTSSHKYYDQPGNFQGVEGIFRDITERKKAEDALRAAYEQITAAEEELRTQLDELKYGQDALRTSEKKLQEIVQGSPIPQFVIDKNHRVISWNNALEQYSGVKAGEVLGTSQQWKAFYPNERPCMADLLVDGTIDKIPEWYRGKYNKSKYVEGAYEATDFFPKMGTNGIWLYFTASTIRDPQGTILGAVETLEDITEIKVKEEALRASEEQFRNVVETQTEFICRFKPDGTHIFVNEAYCRYFDKKCSEIIGKKFIPEIPPEDQARVREHFGSLTRDHPVLTIDHRIIMQDGTIRWQRWVDRAIFDERGVLFEYQTVGRDITDIKQAEAALRESENKLNAIVRGSPIPQFVIDRDHRIIQWNLALESYSGIYAQEVLGTNQQWRAFYPQERPCMADLLIEGQVEKIPPWYAGKYLKSKFIDGGYEATDFFPHMGKSGTWLHFTAAPIRDFEGTVIGAVETLEDITERKKAEERVVKKAAELARSNAELEQFAYIASHDLQEPLRMIASYQQLIERRYKGHLDKDADEFIDYAVDGAKRLQNMINGLLDFSRVQTRGLPFTSVDSGNIFRDAVNNEKIAIRDSGVVITYDPLPIVWADAGQLLRIFQNLIENAIKFHGKEPPAVHVSVQQQDGFAVFSVQDNGIGFNPEYAGKLFTLFRRLHGREYSGTGIGLAVCKRIVERHGGKIWADSVPGRGSIFHFSIPLRGEESNERA